MITAHWLAEIAATQATTAAATMVAATTQAAEQTSLQDDLLAGGYIAWFILAIVALIKFRVFSAKPLRVAPPRAAAALFPVAGGVLALYFVLQIVAILIGVGTGIVPKSMLGLDSGNAAVATASAPATTSNPATTAADSEPDKPSDATLEGEMTVQVLDIGARLGACGCGAIACWFLFRERLKGFGISPRQLGWGILWGLLAYAIVYPFLSADEMAVSAIYDYFRHEISVHNTIQDIVSTTSPRLKLMFALTAGVGAPITEEFFFRGLFQTALIQRGWGFLVQIPADATYRPTALRRWLAILITSTLFCAMHLANPDHIPILMLVSLSLGYIYERTGNLWAAITFHAAFNWTTLIVVLWNGNLTGN